MTEIFIENYRLDVTADISSLLTFALDDVKDFASRQTTFSKTIVLPGTANNNRLFGHIFDTGSSNEYNPAADNVGYNFNAAKSANCIIFQDNLQTFNGTLRLLTINIDKGRKEYEVAVFGNLTRLNVVLAPSSDAGTGLLENLDFSEYNHAFTTGNIKSSWDNSGSAYYYPLIDYGAYSTGKHNWNIGTFRPALYVKEYLDKMFKAAGFRYNCDLFNTDRFKSIIVPHNQKILTSNISTLLDAARTTQYTVLSWTTPGHIDEALGWQTINTLRSFTGTAGTDGDYRFEYTGTDPITLNLKFHIDFGWRLTTTGNKITFEVYKNGSPLATRIFKDVLTTGGILVTSGFWNVDEQVSFNNGDYFEVRAKVSNSSDTSYLLIFYDGTVTGKSQTIVASAIGYGDPVQLNDTIPRNIKQIDFFVSIIKLFNLYVFEDKFDNTLVNIKPFTGDGITEGFFSADTSNAVDWTYKLNRDKLISIKPMSELNSKIYNFKYADDSDFYNDQYKKRYNQNYGDYIFDSQFEFTTDTNDLELIFAGTPLVGYDSEDKIYSTIFKRTGDTAGAGEENVDSVIRILQSKKIVSTMDYPISSWEILQDDGTSFASPVTQTAYGYAGHIDDPNIPGNDLNFGALQVDFALATGDLSNTQFNIYWSGYMAEITDKDSKLVTAYFYLKPSDIFNLDFSKYIYLDGVLFRLNKITDYNVSTPGDCQVELIKVINTTY